MDWSQKEKMVYKDQMFHYGIYLPQPEPYFFGDITWHWHDEFEFAALLGGSMLYKTNHEEFILHEGDGIIVNSGVLHYLKPLEPREDVRLQVQFFDKSFLAGGAGSYLDIKYIAPVQENKQLSVFPLYRREERGRKILEKMEEAAGLSLKRERFFELRLRNIYSELWEILFNLAMELGEEKDYNSLEDERIKQMLTFIQEHYPEKIGIPEIAASIAVSERECHRLFQNGLGTTPVQFLIACRLQKAQELLAETNKSVLEIAMETGFGTSSYFGKLFKQYHHMTPGQYRKISSRTL